MEITKEKIIEIENKILDIIETSLDNGILKEEELQPIAAFVLDTIKTVKTEEELTDFFKKLADTWPIFLPLTQPPPSEIDKAKLAQDDAQKVAAIAQQLKYES